MDRETPQIKGWRSFRFNYGIFSVSIETTTDPDLTTQLERHIEELADGGWADRKPNLDEQEAN